MKDKEIIKCSGCQHCSGLRPIGNTRISFTCSHPDQGYINNYFREKRMQKDARFPRIRGKVFGCRPCQDGACMVP